MFVFVFALMLHAALGKITFEQYYRRLSRSYEGDEYAWRKALFHQRRAEHEALNQRPGRLWTAGVSPETDRTELEFRRARLGYNGKLRKRGVSSSGPPATFALLDVNSSLAPEDKYLPSEVDWRRLSPSVISPVKDQGVCGSCWAITASQVIESHVAIATGVLMDLSPQQLTSCTANLEHCGGTGGCDGATAQLAFNYTIENGGLASVWRSPYTSGLDGKDGNCSAAWANESVASIKGYQDLPENDAHHLKMAVANHGPIAVSVDASNWGAYQRGIFDGCNKTHPVINHAVTLVGYGEEKGIKYWLVRNSWSTLFGENGYIRLRRYDEEPCGIDLDPEVGSACEGDTAPRVVCGECGILSDSSYPTGADRVKWWRRLDQQRSSDIMV
eukprot:TRINITY_DN24409_c1_g1_i1.p1 TRINITY_DN24409_c1_g1~~TRINITY_DN24409_c1_g1_i1.p1  ORF type:complete len:411 (-),score=61.41 TRINITY_DN24409_c1_g1_i1:593-1753(-)